MSHNNMAVSASTEVYFLKPTTHVPNSSLPVLIYRHVLPDPLSEATAIEHLEKHQWSHGGTFKHFPQHHFHTVTHECYAILKGSTRFLFGKGPLDEGTEGVEVDLRAGDVIVDPAGVAHCNLQSSPDLEYIGVYPKASHVASSQHGTPSDNFLPCIFCLVCFSATGLTISQIPTCRSHRSSRPHVPATNACPLSGRSSTTVQSNGYTAASCSYSFTPLRSPFHSSIH